MIDPLMFAAQLPAWRSLFTTNSTGDAAALHRCGDGPKEDHHGGPFQAALVTAAR
jgi:hypothetical protein